MLEKKAKKSFHSKLENKQRFYSLKEKMCRENEGESEVEKEAQIRGSLLTDPAPTGPCSCRPRALEKKTELLLR